MGMPLSHTEWTADMLADIPEDGNRYEVIDGELFVSPAPTNAHQIAVTRLLMLIAPYAVRVGLEPLVAPTAIRFSERTEVQPDVLVVPALPRGKALLELRHTNKLLLAVEILSPSSIRTDRFRKRRLYQSESVPDYWIVDSASRTFEHWIPLAAEPEILAHSISWRPVPEHVPLVIDIEQYFRDVLGE